MMTFLSEKVVRDMMSYSATMTREKLYECVQWLAESHELLREDHKFLVEEREKNFEEIRLLEDKIARYTKAFQRLHEVVPGHYNLSNEPLLAVEAIGKIWTAES